MQTDALLIQEDAEPEPDAQPFKPFLTPSGSLRIPSKFPPFPSFNGRVPALARSRAATPEDGMGQADPLAELGERASDPAFLLPTACLIR